jgi:mRNA-degrading endonuclease RelE of RelBE toxin-antitoxin system
MAAYEIQVHESATREIEILRVFDQRIVMDAIEKHLTNQPVTPTRRRKRLDALAPDFEHTPPVWELRVADFRVFYDVDEGSKVVHVRALRHKGSGQTTEDIT